MTETLAACQFEYIVAQPNKHDQPPLPDEAGNPRLVRFNQDFTFVLVFRTRYVQLAQARAAGVDAN
jgi:hypothetical protein